jgi:hypothetical protein
VYICGAQSDIEAASSCSVTVFLPQYHSTNAPYPSSLKVVDSLWATVLSVAK